MWEHEKALVRDVTNIKYNLAIGDPKIIRIQLPFPRMSIPQELTGGYPSLDATVKLREIIEQFGLTTGTYIVPTVGAKQALHAALAALPSQHIHTPAPYWVSYPTMALYADNAALNQTGAEKVATHIVASPNNPDGRHQSAPESYRYLIWDAAYASQLYGSSQHQEIGKKCDVSVWSGGKLTGNVSARVGWLTTNNKQIADLAQRYVEQTTSGVSPFLQNTIANQIEALYGDGYILERIRKSMKLNYEIITSLPLEFRTATEMFKEYGEWAPRGMFLWMHTPDHIRLDAALEASKIAVLKGEACGMTEPGWYRWSLGLPVFETQEAINALKKELTK